MPRKKQQPQEGKAPKMRGYIAGAGEIVQQDISDTLRQNFMPYAMSVIMSRAIPEIDGFKPSHRKLLYTMYKMGLLGPTRTKSANIVGQTMKLNPHGDAAIYDTMVRLARGYEALLHPYVDSKGNFGKAYSRDMACAASRYTEVKLEKIAAELFRDIDKDTVDMVPNYDNTMTEPSLFPTTFPAVLVNSNVGIAVSMASSICSFNLSEVCETAIALLRDPNANLMETLKGPDFPGGGSILYDEAELRKIYETGRGSVRVRARWRYDKAAGCIEVTEIPPSTTSEAIIDKVIDLVKAGKLKEVSDIRDETDRNGMRIVIELKRDANPQVVLNRLFAQTQLQTTFAINMLALTEVNGKLQPRILSLRHIIDEYLSFQEEIIVRRTRYDLRKAQERAHLLEGLLVAQDNIDEVIKIIRSSYDNAKENLMSRFGLDDVQAQAILDMRLKALQGLDREKLEAEYKELEERIAYYNRLLSDEALLKEVLKTELREIADKCGAFLMSDIAHIAGHQSKAQLLSILGRVLEEIIFGIV